MAKIFELKKMIQLDKNSKIVLSTEKVVAALYDEIKSQHTTSLKKSINGVCFTLLPFDFPMLRWKNRWSNYSSGKFEVFENEKSIVIYFTGDISRIIITSSIAPFGLLIASFFLGSEFNIGILLVLIFFYLFFFAFFYLLERLTTNIYFNNLKRKIMKVEVINMSQTGQRF